MTCRTPMACMPFQHTSTFIAQAMPLSAALWSLRRLRACVSVLNVHVCVQGLRVPVRDRRLDPRAPRSILLLCDQPLKGPLKPMHSSEIRIQPLDGPPKRMHSDARTHQSC